jgi:hypothetical protein
MNNDLLKISLDQGKQFKTYQNKIKKGGFRSKRQSSSLKTKNVKEGFVSVEQELLVRPPDEGYNQIIKNESETTNNINSVNQSQLNELNSLQSKFFNLMQQYNNIQQSIGDSSLATINRMSSNNPYANKNIRFNNGTICYVTSQGTAKPYLNMDIFNLTAGKNGCPSASQIVNIDLPFLASYSPGSVIPTSPSLVVGTNMTQGQSCGLEGKNVYVSNMVSNPQSSYYGCYNDKPAPTEVLLIPTMNSSNSVNGFQSYASSTYQNNNDFAGPWCAFDNNINTWWHTNDAPPNNYDVNTGLYVGQSGVTFNNSSGQSQLIMGEFLQINLPNLNSIVVTKYDIQGRQGCCGDPNGRDPNTWYILGWRDNQWYQIDYQTNISFHWQLKSFNISNPQAYGAYIILVTVVGDSNSQPGNRSSVQIATWNLYTKSDNGFTNDQRAMNYDGGSYVTYEQCQQNAIDNGYQYFGLQDYRSDGTAACLLSNDITKTISYGSANTQTTMIPIWASNTVNNSGAFASLTNEGNLVVYGSDGSVLFSTSSGTPECGKYYSEFPDTDNPGYDIYSSTNMSKEDCKKTCDENENCAGYLVGNTIFQNYCWIKNVSNSSNFNSYPGINYYEKNPTAANKGNCLFNMILQDDGNFCIYKGSDPNNNSGAIWCTMTNGKQKSPNPAWIASNGKLARNYLKSGESLAADEWIGSNDGSIKLIMQQDGNLVLYTSSENAGCIKNNGKTYGGPWVNSVYKIDNLGNKSSLGKVGYIDNNAELKPYPDNMLSLSQNYQIIQGSDSAGHDLGSWKGLSQNDCQTQCNSNANCYGYAYSAADQTCWIKDSSMYPTGGKTPNPNIVLGVRKPSLLNPSGCTNVVEDVDTLQYDNYIKGNTMTPDTQCNSSMVSKQDEMNYDNIKKQLHILGQNISSKMENLYNQDKNIYKKLNMNETQFKKDIENYKNVNINIGKELELESNTNNMEGMMNMNDLNGMLSDSDLIVLQENYSYIFWSVLAIGIVTITINIMKK